MKLFGLLSFRVFFSKNRNFFLALRNVLGFYPTNIALYQLAFSHRSNSKEKTNGLKHSNERLEYLGDAVLGAVVAEMLFKKFPFKEEGFLTEMRSKIVSRDNLKQLALKLGIDQFVKKHTTTDSFRNIYGDALEALIGAIYIDRGYAKARSFIIERMIKHHVDLESLELTENNFKSRILNWSQRTKNTVVFETVGDEKASDKLIRIRLLINGEEVATAMDFVKKKAEQLAAEIACKKLDI